MVIGIRVIAVGRGMVGIVEMRGSGAVRSGWGQEDAWL